MPALASIAKSGAVAGDIGTIHRKSIEKARLRRTCDTVATHRRSRQHARQRLQRLLEGFDILCGTCGGAISVQLRPSDADAAPESTRYTCPWCAAEEFRYQLRGDVLWVARGHHAKDVKPQ